MFTLPAYSSGMRVTSSFVIGGTSTILVLLVPFSWAKLLAVGLIAAGTFLLRWTDV